jgi:hypothetical protein
MQTQNPIAHSTSDFDRISNATRDDSGFLGQRLRFKKGRWLVVPAEKNGKELEVRGKDTFVVDLLSYANGWFKWAENRPVVRLLFRPVDGWKLPARERLPDMDRDRWPTNRDGNPEDMWREVHQVSLKDTSSTGFGPLTWQANGYFQIKNLKRFINKAIPEVKKQSPGMMPVVTLGSVEESSSYGDLPVPALTITGWQPFGDDAAPPGDPDRITEFLAALAEVSPAQGPGMVDITPPPKSLPAKSTARERDPDDDVPF